MKFFPQSMSSVVSSFPSYFGSGVEKGLVCRRSRRARGRSCFEVRLPARPENASSTRSSTNMLKLFQRLDVRGDGSRTDLQVITMVQECALPAGNARYRLDLK
jgi:hypothetical protein